MYRIIGISGHYDKRGADKDQLIREASLRNGVFTLWGWNGKQWKRIEVFIF